MKNRLIKALLESPTTIGVLCCFIATWITLERIENKVDAIKHHVM